MRATPDEILFIRTLVHEKTGILLGGDKSYLVRSLLVPVVRGIGARSLGTLVARLEAEPDGELVDEVIELLLNNETWFFRDHAVFDALRADVLPQLLQRRTRPLRIWSAACATGQEPYSIAMVLRTWFPELKDEVEIFASDLSGRALRRAREGLYTQIEVNRGLPASMLVSHFEEEGSDWRVRDSLRDAVKFTRINLTHAWTELPEMDVVFLRNVSMYFDDATRRDVLTKVHGQLRPEGFLILGSAEATFPHEEWYDVTRSGKAAFHIARAQGVDA